TGIAAITTSTSFTGNLLAAVSSGNNAANTGNLLFLSSSGTNSVPVALTIDLDDSTTERTVFRIVSDETAVSGTAADTLKFGITSAGSVTSAGISPMLNDTHD